MKAKSKRGFVREAFLTLTFLGFIGMTSDLYAQTTNPNAANWTGATCLATGNNCLRCPCVAQYGKGGAYLGTQVYSSSASCYSVCTAPPPPPPPSANPPVTGSSYLVAPSASPKENYYTNRTTDSTAVVGFNYYTAYKPCPLNPSTYTATERSNISNTVTQPVYNSDINGNMPLSPTGKTAATTQSAYTTTTSGSTIRVTKPDDQCWVKSRVFCGGVECTSPSQTIDTNPPPVAAVCPDGYVQVGTFDMQPEVAYNPSTINKDSGTASNSDIPDMQTYNQYVQMGYKCSVPNYAQELKSSCSAAPAGEHNTYTFNYAVNVAYPNPQGSYGVVMFQPGSIRWYDSVSGTVTHPNQCFTGVGGKNCGGTPDITCDLNAVSGYPTYDALSSTAKVYLYNGAIDYYTYFYFSYGFVRCSLPAGPYFTNNMEPRAVLCARIKSQWDKIN